MRNFYFYKYIYTVRLTTIKNSIITGYLMILLMYFFLGFGKMCGSSATTTICIQNSVCPSGFSDAACADPLICCDKILPGL